MSDMEIIARNWRELIRPKGITVDEASATFGRFVAEPFERGFGITIGEFVATHSFIVTARRFGNCELRIVVCFMNL